MSQFLLQIFSIPLLLFNCWFVGSLRVMLTSWSSCQLLVFHLMMCKRGSILALSFIYNKLCNKQQAKALGKKITPNFNLSISSLRLFFKLPKTFLTTNWPHLCFFVIKKLQNIMVCFKKKINIPYSLYYFQIYPNVTLMY